LPNFRQKNHQYFTQLFTMFVVYNYLILIHFFVENLENWMKCILLKMFQIWNFGHLMSFSKFRQFWLAVYKDGRYFFCHPSFIFLVSLKIAKKLLFFFRNFENFDDFFCPKIQISLIFLFLEKWNLCHFVRLFRWNSKFSFFNKILNKVSNISSCNWNVFDAGANYISFRNWN